MFQYKVNAKTGHETYMQVLSETEDELQVRLVTFKDGYEVEKREPMPRRLFETCLRTGYLTAVEEMKQTARKSA